MDDANPYAAPDASAAPASPGQRRVATPDAAIAEAKRRLDEHLADAEAVRADAALAGSRVRPRTWMWLAIFVVGAIGSVAAGLSPDRGTQLSLGIVGAVLAFVGFVAGLASLINDIAYVPRARADDPVRALRGWLLALRTGRVGYVAAAACPTARERPVHPPELDGIPSVGGEFSLADRADAVRWLRTFARPGAGMVRWMKIRRVELVDERGDVAVVRADLRFQAWPNWANVLSLVLFFVIRLIGLIVAVILYYSLRKRCADVIEKTLIRGSDGRWYVLDAELHDGGDG